MTTATRLIDYAAMNAAWDSLRAARFQAAQVAYDSRAEPDADDADERDPVAASDAAMEMAGRADRAYQSGQRAAAADLYRSAAAMLVNAAEVCE